VFLQISKGITDDIVISCYVETALWGAYTMLFFASIYSLLRWGSAKAHHSILASIVVMYIMSTAQFALRLRLVYIELLELLPNILVPDQGSNVYKMQSLVLVVAQTVPLSINVGVLDPVKSDACDSYDSDAANERSPDLGLHRFFTRDLYDSIL